MNLGDGLLFELENGKPKLVLASYGKAKASSKMGFGQVPHKNRTQQKATVVPKQYPKESDRLERDRKCAGPLVGTCGEQVTAHGRRKTRDRTNTDRSHVTEVVRMQSESKTKTTDDSTNVTGKTVQESLVCLTQDQLQQILSTIKGQNVHDDSETPDQSRGPAVGTKEDCIPSETMTSENAERLLDRADRRQGSSPGKRDSKKPLDSSPPGLFSTLGQREHERAILEARRTQWRRELDEQLIQKQQQHARTEVWPRGEPCPGATGPRSCEHLSQVQQDRVTRTGTDETSGKRPQPDHHPRTLPAAIRSAFVLGEAAPLEPVFSEEKEEEQRNWLKNLEQQREEARLRKKLEKQIQSQAEDHERWAMHFDSFQKGLPVQTLPVPAPDRGEASVSVSHQRSPSQALSTAWETMSACGGDSLGRASVDTTQAFQPKSSYLRTMTALLDPAQIEERERKRLKQLEHQRAIEAQVEERRVQKEREEAARRALEQEEERRLERERALLQQQYLKDTQRQRQKEELNTRKTEELFLSVQRAQEEAQKDKHLQRIRELARKGHDVSNLLRSLECESSSEAPGGQGPGFSASSEISAERTQTSTTARKDTAVQTEINATRPPETEVLVAANGDAESQAIRMEYQVSRTVGRLAEKNTGKENMCMAPEADPYEAYARTDRPRGQQAGRKSEWKAQRRSRAFVPASERYPVALQRHRQESRLRRQMELMTLVERNALPKSVQRAPSPPTSGQSQTRRHAHSPHPKVEDVQRPPSTTVTQRGHSPPIPALRHRFHRPSPPQTQESTEAQWPPSSDYIPYVRTDEVYNLDPLAPISRPSTHEDVNGSRQHTPLPLRDPLFNPELLKSTERQQAILKGLSELRQGLLQKQRELETSFNPLL